jgi:hypothetical protein
VSFAGVEVANLLEHASVFFTTVRTLQCRWLQYAHRLQPAEYMSFSFGWILALCSVGDGFDGSFESRVDMEDRHPSDVASHDLSRGHGHVNPSLGHQPSRRMKDRIHNMLTTPRTQVVFTCKSRICHKQDRRRDPKPQNAA